MFWAILSAISFAYFFYSWGKSVGWQEGRRYHEQRAEEMLRHEEIKAILDPPPPTAQRQPLHLFGSTRPDVRRIK